MLLQQFCKFKRQQFHLTTTSSSFDTTSYLEVLEEGCPDKLPHDGVDVLLVEAMNCTERAVTQVIHFAWDLAWPTI